MPKPAQTTKEFVSLSDIRDSVVVLKNGSLRAVIEVGSLNFDLKSADEQMAIVTGFQSFLNSVDFPLQIVVNSRKLDIMPYLKSLEGIIESQQNELFKIQAVEYTRFVKGLTELANIMAKKFYVVVPFLVIPLAAGGGGIMDKVKSLFGSAPASQLLGEEQLKEYAIQLEQRTSMVMSGLGGLGLNPRVLSRDEMTDLYYSYYNPGQHLS